MKKTYTLLSLLAFFLKTHGQLPPFGLVDTADLKLRFRYFEKDDNPEVLLKKIPFVFNLVKTSMKFNGFTRFYSDSEISRAWSGKVRNMEEMDFFFIIC